MVSMSNSSSSAVMYSTGVLCLNDNHPLRSDRYCNAIAPLTNNYTTIASHTPIHQKNNRAGSKDNVKLQCGKSRINKAAKEGQNNMWSLHSSYDIYVGALAHLCRCGFTNSTKSES